MQFTTKSEFQNDGRLYITDDDNGIKDIVFWEILGFQPTMGWMYARGQEVALFVDDRYYEGVSKRLNERLCWKAASSGSEVGPSQPSGQSFRSEPTLKTA